MKNITLNKIVTLCFVALFMIFVSCSSDDDKGSDDDDNVTGLDSNSVEVSADYLGGYDGSVVFEIENSGDATATLVETADKTYSINFSDDFSSFEDIHFFLAVGQDNVFVAQNSETTGIGVVLAPGLEGGLTMTVTQENDDGTDFVFVGFKQ